ncbi:hypothetical protein JZU68_04730, partial [bacterium]|nr:hypothetical protein [bacterium]
MEVDEELISRSNQEKSEADNSESDAFDSDMGEDEDEDEESEEDESSSLREEIQKSKNGVTTESTGDIRKDKLAAKRAQKVREIEVKKAAVSKPTNPAKKSTSGLLKAAWENLIDSFGLTIIWIDIHIFLSHVLGRDLFCELGEEWFPDGTPRNIDGAKRSVGMTEGMGVACINVGCLLL